MAALRAEVAECKESISKTETEQKDAEKRLNEALAQIPNTPLDDVPDGKDPADNVEHHRFGKPREFTFKPQQHFDLGEKLGQMDFETAAKLSGARFVVLKGGLARMERALGQFMLDVHTGEHGYTEVNPPLLVRDEVMYGTAQLPRFEGDQFFAMTWELINAGWQEGLETPEWMEEDPRAAMDPAETFDLFLRYLESGRLGLIPTAEVPLTNLVRESIQEESALPLRYTACTPCFRAEAGAAGKDTRGMIRQHQFTKVELVSITTPEQGRDEHERMLSCA